jgi:CheY-like chemotaxis protein
MPLNILLVEDDHIQRSDICAAIEQAVQGTVSTLCCEWDFQTKFEEIASNPPDLVVMDVMLRWQAPSRNLEPPPSGHPPESAGLRCAARLRSDARTQSVKVILYSVFPPESIADLAVPGRVLWVVKELDLQNLFDAINRILHESASGSVY